MTTPAGWYDDPGAPAGSDQLRWWDGTSWTAHTRGRDEQLPPVHQYGTHQYGTQQYGTQQYGSQQQYGTPQYGQQLGVPGYEPKPTSTPDGVPLANVLARLGAKLLDFLLIGLLNVLVTLPAWPAMLRAAERYGEAIDRAAVNGTTPDFLGLYGDPGYQRFVVWSALSALVITAAYTVLMLRFKGATLGKMAFGMRVRSWDRAGQLGWGACFARWAVESLLPQVTCGLWFFVDSLWCTWDRRRQTLHDKAAGTVVVARR